MDMDRMMQMQGGGDLGQGEDQAAPESLSEINRNKILSTAKNDIKRAEDYFKNQIEPKLIERYDVYYSDKERYAKKYPQLSGISDVRAFDLWSAIEWLLPNMLRAFFGSNRIISISGNESEDAQRAERVSKLIQWQLTVKNQGYRQFKGWFGDALATNLGVLKCYWKRETETIPHQQTFDRQGLIGVLEDPHNKILASEPVPTLQSMLGLGPMQARLTWEEEKFTVNQPVIEAIRPSDIRFTPDGKTLGECSMVAHRKVVTIDHLRREAKRGLYDPEAVEEIAKSAQNDDYKPTELDQQLNDAERNEENRDANPEEPSRVRVLLYECYLKSDIDGDGLLEDAIVTVCNDQLLRAVENPYGRAPFFDLVPFWDSYQIWARMGLCEVIEDIQDSHTALLRQMLRQLGLSNQWRAVVNENEIYVDDLVDDAQFIRAKSNPKDAFMEVPHPGLNPQNFPFLEYLQGELEQWTPLTRYNQGLDASSLNKTATGISMIMNASQQRQEEIVRNFAETGIRDLYRFLIQLNQRYLDQRQVVRLQNEVLEITPDDINGDFDLSVDGSSGVGAIDAKVQVLTSYLREMFPAALQIGAAGPQQFIDAGRKLLQLMGIEDADKYLLDPMQVTVQNLRTMMQQQQLMGGLGLGQQGGVAPGAPAAAGPAGGPGGGGPVGPAGVAGGN